MENGEPGTRNLTKLRFSVWAVYEQFPAKISIPRTFLEPQIAL